jgi:hypothetical protein
VITPKDGDLVWTCEPSDEKSNYKSRFDPWPDPPQRPRLAKAAMTSRGGIVLHYVDPKTGEPQTESSSSVHWFNGCFAFATKADADDHFRSATTAWAESMRWAILRAEASAAEYLANG